MADTLDLNPLKAIRLLLSSTQDDFAGSIAMFAPRCDYFLRGTRKEPKPLRFVRLLERRGIECRWDHSLWDALFTFLRQLESFTATPEALRALQRETALWGAREAQRRSQGKKNK
jgi:hypothetical protein